MSERGTPSESPDPDEVREESSSSTTPAYRTSNSQPSYFYSSSSSSTTSSSAPLPLSAAGPTDTAVNSLIESEATAAVSTTASPRNFVVMIVYLVAQRLGWIFKTESIIMPAVADLVGVGAWLRGCLPVLSRFGLSVPPLLSSQHVRRAPRKQRWLFSTSVAMSLLFLLLAWVWRTRAWFGGTGVALAFLAIYTLFFVAVGVNQLVLGTLNGKLIAADRRGRLLLLANVFGAGIAIGAAIWLLPRWLADPDDFVYIFAFSGIVFGANAAVALMFAEPADQDAADRHSPATMLHKAWRVLRRDAMFRRAAWIAALFGLSFALFPHYQAIALEQLGLGHVDMMSWVVIQNLGTAAFSLLVGPVADRRGNRSVLRVVMLSVLAAPVVAICLPHIPYGDRYFPLVFLLVGMSPVTVRILHNYVLELSEPADHPLYLSTLSLVAGIPVMLSPVLGMVIDATGFEGSVPRRGGAGVLGVVFDLVACRATPRAASISPRASAASPVGEGDSQLLGLWPWAS